jgi:hypothetical protein
MISSFNRPIKYFKISGKLSPNRGAKSPLSRNPSTILDIPLDEAREGLASKNRAGHPRFPAGGEGGRLNESHNHK